jgi:hypothetical protein
MFSLHNYITLGRFQGDDDAIVCLSFSCGKCIKKINDRSGEIKIILARDRACYYLIGMKDNSITNYKTT